MFCILGVDVLIHVIFGGLVGVRSIKEDNLYTYIIPVTNQKKLRERRPSAKIKYSFTYNAKIEVFSVEARPQ